MQMSKQKQLLILITALLLMVSLPPLLAMAQDRQPTEATEQPQQAPQERSAAGSEDPRNTTPPGEQTEAGAKATPLKEFTPTDKIGADSAVSFPVDI